MILAIVSAIFLNISFLDIELKGFANSSNFTFEFFVFSSMRGAERAAAVDENADGLVRF